MANSGLTQLSMSLPPPFVDVQGVVNIRAVGGCRTTSQKVKNSSLFRSGELSRITPAGKEKLLSLGVRKVFDMRSDVEIASYGTTVPVIEGLEIVRIPIAQEIGWDSASLQSR